MTRRLKLILAAGIGAAVLAGGTAYAFFQSDASVTLRASGKVGEQADGYLGIVGSVDAGLRAQVDAVNIKRRAYYTELASRRGAKIEEVAAAMACEIFASRVGAGQYYRGQNGNWRQRDGAAPVPRPSYCG